jgi:hypothetical protein
MQIKKCLVVLDQLEKLRGILEKGYLKYQQELHNGGVDKEKQEIQHHQQRSAPRQNYQVPIRTTSLERENDNYSQRTLPNSQYMPMAVHDQHPIVAKVNCTFWFGGHDLCIKLFSSVNTILSNTIS